MLLAFSDLYKKDELMKRLLVYFLWAVGKGSNLQPIDLESVISIC